MKALCLLVVVVLGGCRAWRDELAIKSESECIQKKCTNHEPTEYQQCTSACRRTYGK